MAPWSDAERISHGTRQTSEQPPHEPNEPAPLGPGAGLKIIKFASISKLTDSGMVAFEKKTAMDPIDDGMPGSGSLTSQSAWLVAKRSW